MPYENSTITKGRVFYFIIIEETGLVRKFEIKRIMRMHPRLVVIIPEHSFPDSLQMLLIPIMLNRKRSNVQFLKVQAFQNLRHLEDK